VALAVERHAARDGEEPRPQPARVGELGQARAGHQEGVVEGVLRFLAILQDPPQKVVEPSGVAVVDGGKGVFVASRRSLDELGFVHGAAMLGQPSLKMGEPGADGASALVAGAGRRRPDRSRGGRR
jgi:hypothetical protein